MEFPLFEAWHDTKFIWRIQELQLGLLKELEKKMQINIDVKWHNSNITINYVTELVKEMLDTGSMKLL